MADRYGRKPMLMITILTYSVGTLASGLSIGFWTLFAARAVTGIGVGGEWAVAHALVGETVPPAVRGRYGSYLQSGSAFARFFASMAGLQLAPLIGWRAVFMLSAVPALLVVVVRRQMPESDVWLLSIKDGVNKRIGYVAALGQMVGPALRRTTTLALSVTTLNMAAYWFKTIWLPTYLHETRGLSLNQATTLLLMDQIRSVATATSRSASRAITLVDDPGFTAFSIVKALGLAMITLGWNAAGGYTATTFGFMLLVGFGEGNWGCIGPLLNEVFPTSVRAAALGIIYNTARGVQFLAPTIIAMVATKATFWRGHRACRAIFTPRWCTRWYGRCPRRRAFGSSANSKSPDLPPAGGSVLLQLENGGLRCGSDGRSPLISIMTARSESSLTPSSMCVIPAGWH